MWKKNLIRVQGHVWRVGFEGTPVGFQLASGGKLYKNNIIILITIIMLFVVALKNEESEVSVWLHQLSA